MLKLMYITNDPRVAEIADDAGVDRMFIDLETVGKQQRQGGMNTVQSYHTTEDVKTIRRVLKNSELLVRVNPIYDGSADEIERVIENGADVLMLPFFQNASQVDRFLHLVNDRARTMLLVETPEAVEHLDEILDLPGIDECHVGLNDLHLGYHRKFMFELLADGTVDTLSETFRRHHIPFGFGGIARIHTGTLPAEMILGEHLRLGSEFVILSRSFCDTSAVTDYEEVRQIFNMEVQKIRNTESRMQNETEEFFRNNRSDVQKIVHQITESMK